MLIKSLKESKDLNEKALLNWSVDLNDKWNKDASVVCDEYLTTINTEQRFLGSIEYETIGDIELANIRSNALSVEKISNNSHVKNNNYILIIQTKGHSFFEQLGQRVELLKGEMLLLDQRLPYLFQFSKEVNHLTLKLPMEYIQPYFKVKESLGGKKINREFGISCSLLNYVNYLNVALKTENELKFNLCLEILTKLVVIYFSNGYIKLTANERKAIKLNEVKSYIQNNLTDSSLSIDKITSNNSVSRRQLYNIFEPYGYTPYEWLKMQRLKYASRMLQTKKYNQYPISYISESSGFSDLAYFSRLFSKSYNIPPGQFRNQKLL